MKIALINGSPKKKNSGSGLILNALKNRLGQDTDCVLCHGVTQKSPEIIEAISGCDALVFAFPLYVDGLPSHLLRLLDESRGDIAAAAPEARVYAVANNGFYEGSQNIVALEIMRGFCDRAGLKWGQGLEVGAGGMIAAAPIGKGPMKNLGKALDTLADNILNGKAADDYICKPNFPKFLYKAFAHFGWRVQAGKNGLKVKQLYNKP